MAWFNLMIAGLFEIVWTTFLKLSDGFSKPNFTVYTIAGMIVSFYFLAQATKVLPLGTAYAIWAGIGAPVVGIVLFREPVAPSRLFFVTLLVVGIFGLKLTSASA